MRLKLRFRISLESVEDRVKIKMRIRLKLRTRPIRIKLGYGLSYQPARLKMLLGGAGDWPSGVVLGAAGGVLPERGQS